MIPVLPQLPGMGWGKKTTIWATKIATSASGREIRSPRWSAPIYKWSAPINVLRDPETQQLLTAFMASYGQCGLIRYMDPFDHTATGQTIAIGDGTTTSFQLIRTIAGYTDVVRAPAIVSAVHVGGVSATGYTIDSSTGILTLTAPPAAGSIISCDFTFYFLVRFSSDELQLADIAAGLRSVEDLSLVSVKS